MDYLGTGAIEGRGSGGGANPRSAAAGAGLERERWDFRRGYRRRGDEKKMEAAARFGSSPTRTRLRALYMTRARRCGLEVERVWVCLLDYSQAQFLDVQYRDFVKKKNDSSLIQ